MEFKGNILSCLTRLKTAAPLNTNRKQKALTECLFMKRKKLQTFTGDYVSAVK